MLLDDRAPSSPELTDDQAVAELTHRYFSSHGPATLEDFAWWSGLTKTQCRQGIAAVGDRLAAEEDEDGTTWLAAPGAAPVENATGAFLIPIYDELGVAYKKLRMVYAGPPPRPGLMCRPVVIDGECVGSWRRTLTARETVVQVTLLVKLDQGRAEALEAATARFGAFLGLSASLESGVAVQGSK